MEAYFTIIFWPKHVQQQHNPLLPFYCHERFPVGATQQMTGILLLPAHHEFTYIDFLKVCLFNDAVNYRHLK
jgi:hypothetical protein